MPESEAYNRVAPHILQPLDEQIILQSQPQIDMIHSKYLTFFQNDAQSRLGALAAGSAIVFANLNTHQGLSLVSAIFKHLAEQQPSDPSLANDQPRGRYAFVFTPAPVEVDEQYSEIGELIEFALVNLWEHSDSAHLGFGYGYGFFLSLPTHTPY